MTRQLDSSSHHAQQPDHPEVPTQPLCPEDCQVLDGLVDCRFQPDGPLSDRQQRMLELLGVLEHCYTGRNSGGAPGDLVASTLGRIEQARHSQHLSQRAGALRLPMFPVSWSEIGAIAAMMIIGISLALPVLVRGRADARRIACSTNLGLTSMALGHYAADHHGVLPRGQVQPGSAWFNVGQAADRPIESNSAHLYLLARAGYLRPGTMTCPENPHAPRGMTAGMHDWPSPKAVSFSYQNQHAPAPTRPERTPRMAVLADRNPLFDVADGRFAQRNVDPTTSSVAHGKRGQNVLLAGGEVVWTHDPVLPNGDNIWLARGIDRYVGRESPADPGDAFLVP